VRGDLQPATQHASLVHRDLQTRRTAPQSGLVPRIATTVVRRGALPPREPNQAARSPPRFESSRCFPLVFSRRHGARRPKKSLAPSSDDVPHRGSSAMLKAPPQSAASQVLTGCHCRKRRCSTLSRTALEISKQHQTPWNTASRRTNSQVETLDHQHESRRLGVG
jgi:hypothetical protein